mmetsp:Transcript_42338/g.105687  ORF Transcript_42338/g.105687 Transcript_42338/m.105687 type:complete len:107 (-) Transcript_42338:53-373(-)
MQRLSWWAAQFFYADGHTLKHHSPQQPAMKAIFSAPPRTDPRVITLSVCLWALDGLDSPSCLHCRVRLTSHSEYSSLPPLPSCPSLGCISSSSSSSPSKDPSSSSS